MKEDKRVIEIWDDERGEWVRTRVEVPDGINLDRNPTFKVVEYA